MVDGDVLPDLPINIRQSKKYNRVPLMIGKTQDEMNFYLIKCMWTLLSVLEQ